MVRLCRNRACGAVADLTWDDFKAIWRGERESATWFAYSFAALCVGAALLLRWSLSFWRPDVLPFTTFYAAIIFATIVGGRRPGLFAAVLGGLLGGTVHFTEMASSALSVNLGLYVVASAVLIFGLDHYRSIASHYRQQSERLAREEEYRKLIVGELEHRLKNKIATVHAVIRQVLREQPQAWDAVDERIRALGHTDELIARTDGVGCDIVDLLQLELVPYGSSRVSLLGEPLMLPAKLAVTLALMFHELATNAAKYGAFSSPTGLLQVSWQRSKDRLSISWDETHSGGAAKPAAPGFGTRLLNSALNAFDGKIRFDYLETGLHCVMNCRIPED